MNLLKEQVIKRAFKRHEQIHIGRFFQSAGLMGLNKKQAKNLLRSCVKTGEVKKRNRWFLELPM
jgi:hypothetical protein